MIIAKETPAADRVKFVGPPPSEISPMQPLRGPTSGYGGQVFLVFGEDGPSKRGLDLIDQWQKGMTLEVFAKMAMASFVLVIPYTPLPFPCAGSVVILTSLPWIQLPPSNQCFIFSRGHLPCFY
ncbi:unnamed protein product, partial [Vitis vinifera]|uniref:Uncharacterized protein n=1 Tax=Vitis vinifera TaxID=29760 RepID=D7U268_VITVI